MKRIPTHALIAAGFAGVLGSSAFGGVVFSEDFESGLGAWTGKRGRAHHGAAVIDPVSALNTALTFTRLNAWGDLFSKQPITLDTSLSYTISFDYLGMTDQGMNPAVGTNGHIGLSRGLRGSRTWLYATQARSGAQAVLIDDSTWHSYEFALNVPKSWVNSNGRATFHLMLEDFYRGGGVAGDAYFDNISIQSVPEPASLACLMGVAGISARRRRA